jgi:hypothetical protein
MFSVPLGASLAFVEEVDQGKVPRFMSATLLEHLRWPLSVTVPT